MPSTIFPARTLPTVPVAGERGDYPLCRIFCVGRNYADHAREMGAEVDREAPFYFTKSPFAYAASGETVPYPLGTSDYHHEVELAVAIGAPLVRAGRAEAARAVYGYACALDMTRRDLQAAAKAARRPWDLGKDVEGSAVIGAIRKAEEIADLDGSRISLRVNGDTRQSARLSDMVHDVPSILADLSKYYHLAPGDIVLTGTPAGVGPVTEGDDLVGEIAGVGDVRLRIGPADPA